MGLDPDLLRSELVTTLARSGPGRAADLCLQLRISQPTLSRLVRRSLDQVLVVGRARTTRYAARRTVEGVRAPIPVFEVRSVDEAPRHLLDLHPIRPDGFWIERHDGTDSTFADDLPWFLNDLRPAGFLGRLLPRRFPDLGAPDDIGRWSADDVLRYLARFGWNLPGALIVGEDAFARFTRVALEPPDRVPATTRTVRYPELATDVLAFGPAGSSAGGEQPKFLATRDDGEALVPVLVKFSPPLTDAPAVRTADLLVAEHVAHRVLADDGHPAARSSLLRADNRLFLEIERFDRQGPANRRGLASLFSVDAEFVGSRLDRWSTTTAALVALGLLGEVDHREVRWLEAFGRFIANTDMHPGNLSLWLDGTRLAGVAPVYDMLPMLYAARQGELPAVAFDPAVPSPADRDVARTAWTAANTFWNEVAAHPEVSAGFRACARDNQAVLQRLAPLLPVSP